MSLFTLPDSDDEQFMPQTGGSGLASIFGANKVMDSDNSSLTYTAPKQPKKQSKGAAQPEGHQLLVATAVEAQKHVDGKYVPQGKLGCAVLGLHSAKDYKLLVYVSQKKHVTTAKIDDSFVYTVQAANYSSFYDDQRKVWSFLFADEEDSSKLAKQVAICKAIVAGNSLSLIKQDLVIGSGNAKGVAKGDSVEVKYCGWLLENNTFGKVFDSNTTSDKAFRFKVGKGKVIKGWDEGMVGMTKGGKRLIIIPPSLGYGSQGVPGRVPGNSTLLFEVELKKIKLSKEREAEQEPPRIDSPPPPVETKSHNSSVRVRTQSMEEQLGNVQDGEGIQRSDILNRISKMGQSMLPTGASPASGVSEDDIARSTELPQSSSSQLNQQFNSQAGFQQQQSGMGNNMMGMGQGNVGVGQGHMGVGQGVMGVGQAGMGMGQGGMGMGLGVRTSSPYSMQSSQQAMTSQAGGLMMGMGGAPMMSGVGAGAGMMGMVPQRPPAVNNQLALYQSPPQQMFGQSYNPYSSQQQPPGGYSNQVQPQMMAGPTLYPQPPPPAPPPAPSPALSQVQESSINTTLLNETRREQTEVRLEIGKISTKLDDMTSKLDRLREESQSGIGSSALMIKGSSTPNMEAVVLLHNFQRVIQDSEHLKKEVFEKSARIETQNLKIAELLERNQRFVEQSNSMLEQRNDAFKSTTASSNAKVLQLEQEKVFMVTEFSATTSKLSTLQMELTSTKKSENELKTQLAISMAEVVRNASEWATAKQLYEESSYKAGMLAEEIKEERATIKTLRMELQQSKDEYTDTKNETEAIERALADRKKKSASLKHQFEIELEEVKQTHEAEMTQLKERLRKEKHSASTVVSEQVAQAEREVEDQWRIRSERLVAQTEERARRKYADLQDEYKSLQNQLTEVTMKMENLKRQNAGAQLREAKERLTSSQEEQSLLQGELAEVRGREKALREQLSQVERLWRQRLEQSVAAVRVAMAGARSSSDSLASAKDVSTKVKSIMNQAFQMMSGKFKTKDSYLSKEILGIVMNVIKEVTLKGLDSNSSVASAVTRSKIKSESTEDETEEEEDEEEEEMALEEEEEEEEEEREKEASSAVDVKEKEKKAAVEADVVTFRSPEVPPELPEAPSSLYTTPPHIPPPPVMVDREPDGEGMDTPSAPPARPSPPPLDDTLSTPEQDDEDESEAEWEESEEEREESEEERVGPSIVTEVPISQETRDQPLGEQETREPPIGEDNPNSGPAMKAAPTSGVGRESPEVEREIYYPEPTKSDEKEDEEEEEEGEEEEGEEMAEEGKEEMAKKGKEEEGGKNETEEKVGEMEPEGTRKDASTAAKPPGGSKHLFGSDDEDDDMFFTPAKTTSKHTTSNGTFATESLTQEQKAALSVAAFGASATAAADEHNLFAGGASDNKIVPEKQETKKKVVSNPLFGDDDDDEVLDWLS